VDELARHVARVGRREIRPTFWSGNIRVREKWQDVGVDGENIKMDVREKGG
jgi:hypothetical protein